MRQLVMAVCLLMLTACTSGGYSPNTAAGPTVTPDAGALPTLTPFGPATAQNPVDTSSSSPVATQSPTISFSPSTPSEAPNPPHYTLEVSLDYPAHHVSVDETILYQNSTGEVLPSLVLAVEPNLWTGCFRAGDLAIDGQLQAGFSLQADRLEIPLAAPLTPGTSLTLTFHYDLDLPEADSEQVFGYNSLQANLVDWYPFIVPYADGWLLHPPAEVGEHLVYDEAGFDVKVTLVNSTQLVVLAASAPGEEIAGSWHYSLQKARSFTLSASPEYQSSTITAEGIIISSYFFEAEHAQAQAALPEIARAVSTFSALFGSLPYASLSIVESPFYDGMEYDGLFYLSRAFYTGYDGTALNYLIDISVHETAHQWWFGLVGNDQAMEPWLDEALATYSELLFYERNHPEVTGWWNFRVNAYSPSGKVDTDIYHGINFRRYANAVYLRGAKFLDAVRGRVGDEAFLAFLKDYATQMGGRRASAKDFFRILREHTTADLSDIIANYFQRQQ